MESSIEMTVERGLEVIINNINRDHQKSRFNNDSQKYRMRIHQTLNDSHKQKVYQLQARFDRSRR